MTHFHLSLTRKEWSCYFFEEIVGGSSEMEGFLKAYFTKFANKLVTSHAMKEFFCDYFKDKDLSMIDWDHLFNTPGMPENLPSIESPMLDKCEKLANELIDVATSTRVISYTRLQGQFDCNTLEYWYPQVTMILLEKVSDGIEEGLKTGKVSRSQLRRFLNYFGEFYKLDYSTNAEIKFRWLMICLLSGERKEEAAAMASSVGRMKFTRPLYRALMKVDLDFAVKIFTENEDFYHPICRKMVKSDLQKAGAQL